jgi:hypothetical protein
MKELEGNSYHRRKFNHQLKSIAQEGRFVRDYSCCVSLIKLAIGFRAQQNVAAISLNHSKLDWIRTRRVVNYQLDIC